MRDEGGFVLLDRAVVAAVGVVVAIVLVVATRGADRGADRAACRQDAAQVTNAVEAYRALHDTVPTPRALVDAHLLSKVSALHTIEADADGSGYRVVPTKACADR
jgi:hypothetical protein